MNLETYFLIAFISWPILTALAFTHKERLLGEWLEDRTDKIIGGILTFVIAFFWPIAIPVLTFVYVFDK